MTPMEEKGLCSNEHGGKRTGCTGYHTYDTGNIRRTAGRLSVKPWIAPEKIIIGHMDLSRDIEKILQVLDMGVNVGFDTVGKLAYCPDTFRVEALHEIAEPRKAVSGRAFDGYYEEISFEVRRGNRIWISI